MYGLIPAIDYVVEGDRIWAKMLLKVTQIKSWTVSDALWCKMEPLVPDGNRPSVRKYRRKPGAGRKPMAARRGFSAIVYVLRAGCQWKALPKEFGSSSAVHKHFQQWRQAGLFLELWRAGLAEYDEMEGIAWNWQTYRRGHGQGSSGGRMGRTLRIGEKNGRKRSL